MFFFRNFANFARVSLNFAKKRSEKTEIARSKRKHRKGRGQAAAKKRSPLLRMWKRGRARSAKVHACGAQINREFQEISRECEGCLKIEDARAVALEARYGCWRTAAEERKKPKIGRAAAAVRDGWNRGTKIIKKKKETESNTG